MPEIHLKKPGFTYSGFGPFTKKEYKKEYKKRIKTKKEYKN